MQEEPHQTVRVALNAGARGESGGLLAPDVERAVPVGKTPPVAISVLCGI